MDTNMTQAQTQITDLRTDLSDLVRDSALLANLTVSQWEAERTDKGLMKELKANHNAVGNTGRVVKNLLAGCDQSLRELRSAYTAARALHHELTLPWVSTQTARLAAGPRLLPNLHFLDYCRRMGALKQAAEARLDAFIADYPTLMQQAMSNLAGMAKADDYPSAEMIRASFKLSFDFTPIPPGGAFRNLPDNVLVQLDARLRTRQEAAAKLAQAAMWERVRESVSHLAERLADADTRFKAASVDAVKDLIKVLPGFNVCNDPRVDEITEDIKTMIAGVTPEDLRNDALVRNQVAARANALTHKLSGWGL
jgi:hypothetical protein